MMKAALKHLLNRLDAIAEEHGEVTDTDVREQMYEAVYHGFIVQTPGYTLPGKFGLFEEDGNTVVRTALSEFIAAACAAGIAAPADRFAAFQDETVLSDDGNPYDEYFGHSDNFEQLTAVMSPSPKPPPPPSAPRKPWWKFWG
jgi:hypothetical protein